MFFGRSKCIHGNLVRKVARLRDVTSDHYQTDGMRHVIGHL